jgi:PAS domain S-box-containing protein
MSKLLENKGYQVITVENGLDALDILKSFTPDAMLVDLIMPNIDGEMLCRVIRGNEKFKDVYLIILSAISAEESIDIEKFGANACIAKGPFDEMAQHVLAALGEPELAAMQCLSGEVLGVQSVFPRGITQELLSIKNHFELILERMSEGILEINPEGRIVYANPAASMLIDIPGNHLLGSYFVDLFSENDHQRVCDLMAIKSSKPKRITERAPVLVNGFQVTLKILPLDDDASQSIIILNDVSEHKRSEEALKSAKEYAQNIIDSSIDMIISVDNDRKIVEFNRAAERTFGYRKEEVKGKEVSMLYADPEEGVRIRKKANENGLFVGEITNKRKDGSTFPTLLSFGLMRDKAGKEIGVVGVSRDITEQKRSKEALRESEEKYRNVLESIEDGYYEVDLDGNLTFFNDSMCKILRYTRNELMGMNNRKFMDQENAKKIYQTFNQVYKSGISTKALDWKLNRKDGSECFVETVVSLIKDAKEQPLGFRGIARDVTERKRGEQEKKRLEAQLYQAERIESLGILAGGIAHDFNNLLMGVQGHTSLMLSHMDPSHPHMEHLKGIENYVKSASDLTKQLLGFAMGGKYEVKATNLNELIKSQSSMFGRTRKEINIRENYEEGLWAVDVDRRQIEQVLLNLFVNAWQAMPGGGNLIIQTENRIVDENYNKPYNLNPGKYIMISISDTGIGMDETTQRRIFDPFFTTKEMKRGSGLGLASSYGIIKNHSGYIDVYSEKGNGTTFEIYLPASTNEVVKEENLHGEAFKGSETILFVDDEYMVIDVCQQILKELGYRVFLARSGKEAIEIYRRKQDEIDMVILDMIMPEMGGGETYDKLKEFNPDVKVLLSSGYSIDGLATEILDRGCDGFIQKPFGMKDLSRKLREILGKK